MARFLVLLQAVLAVLPAIKWLKRPFGLLTAGIVLAGAGYLCVFAWRSAVVLSVGITHALIYLALLSYFASSLFPGRQPVVTMFSHVIHGPLPERVDRYTRRVTWVWVVFCVAQLLGSASLLTLAPLAWWSTFVNILNLPSVALLFVGEILTRPVWLSNPPRERLGDMMRIFRIMSGGAYPPGTAAR
ncbi:MAG TPA: hypothetical protein VL574_15425 [Stellaceae bacterium]|nr:hypothetical protein [Stellaceae bacterium]